MSTDFLFYWKLKNVRQSLGNSLNHASGRQLRRVSRGDRLWIVTAHEDELFLVGRIIVGKVVDYETAATALGGALWDSDYHALSKKRTEVYVSLIPLKQIAFALRFESDRDRLIPKGLGQQLQTMRRLTSTSAELLSYVLSLADSTGENQREKAGAGFGHALENILVESAAITAATAFITDGGWTVESVEGLQCGYDLRCRRFRQERHVEVKGVKGDTVSFVITAGEVKEANRNRKWELIVVTRVLGSPVIHQLSRDQFLKGFELRALQFKATRRRTRRARRATL
ncbi:MAG: DUF3883 domain-containing protein [Acidobacteriota bacterium]